MIVSTPRELLWAWLDQRIGLPWSQDFRAIGSVKDGCLAAVVAYNAFAGRSCVLHAAVDDPVAVDRGFVRAIFEYPFEQLGLTHLQVYVSVNNTRALDIYKRGGFKEIYRLVGAGFDGEDMLFLVMHRSDCRLLERIKHGWRRISSGSTGLRSGGEGSGRSELASHPGTDDRQSAERLHSVGLANVDAHANPGTVH